MSKIFEIDYRKGTFIDSVSNESMIENGTVEFKKTEKGYGISNDGSNNWLNKELVNTITEGTIVYAIKTQNATQNCSGVSITNAFGTRFESYVTASKNFRLFSSGSYQDSINEFNDNKYHLVMASFDTTNKYIYIDNELQTLSNGNTAGTQDVNTILLGKVSSTVQYLDGCMVFKSQIYDTILTQAERDDLYVEFLNSFSPVETKTNFVYPKSTDLSNETGLQAAYNMVPSSGGVLTDISGNGNNGTITGALSTKDGMKFDGVDDKIVFGNIGNIKSIAFRIKLATTTEQILEGATNDKLILSNVGILTYTDFDNTYINGVDSDTITAGDWCNIVITSTTGIDMSACTLALNNVSYGAFEIEDLKFYSNELTLQEVIAYHNSFIKPTLIESFKDYPVGQFPDKNWNKVSGEAEIKENTQFKYLSQTSDGVNSIYYNGSTNVTAKVILYNGTSWEELVDTLENLISDSPALSYSNNRLFYQFLLGQGVREIIIYNGIKQ